MIEQEMLGRPRTHAPNNAHKKRFWLAACWNKMADGRGWGHPQNSTVEAFSNGCLQSGRHKSPNNFISDVTWQSWRHCPYMYCMAKLTSETCIVWHGLLLRDISAANLNDIVFNILSYIKAWFNSSDCNYSRVDCTQHIKFTSMQMREGFISKHRCKIWRCYKWCGRQEGTQKHLHTSWRCIATAADSITFNAFLFFSVGQWVTR